MAISYDCIGMQVDLFTPLLTYRINFFLIRPVVIEKKGGERHTDRQLLLDLRRIPFYDTES